MLAVNLGSKGFTEALAMLEYCNHPGGSYWSDLRKKNGSPDPHDVKVWCLGNEMDGPWQMNHRTAYEYGRVANEVGRGMKVFDSSLELVACGSSHANMPTYPDWEAEVLERVLRQCRLHLAAHLLGQLGQRLPELRRQVGAARPLHPHRRRHHRLREGEEALEARRLHLLRRVERLVSLAASRASATATASTGRRRRALLEDVYNFEDVLLVGCALNTFIRRSDRVKVACIAQLVNVIAPIMTETGGPAWKQTTYYPYHYASLLRPRRRAQRRRRCADLRCQGGRRRALSRRCRGRRAATARRSTSSSSTAIRTRRWSIDIDMAGFAPKAIAEHVVIAHPDLKATNTARSAEHGQAAERQRRFGRATARSGASLPPRSYHLLRVSV